jgi:hypothetical protein
MPTPQVDRGVVGVTIEGHISSPPQGDVKIPKSNKEEGHGMDAAALEALRLRELALKKEQEEREEICTIVNECIQALEDEKCVKDTVEELVADVLVIFSIVQDEMIDAIVDINACMDQVVDDLIDIDATTEQMIAGMKNTPLACYMINLYIFLP